MAFLPGAAERLGRQAEQVRSLVDTYAEALEACKDAQEASKGAGGGPIDFLGVGLGEETAFAEIGGLAGCLQACPRGRRRGENGGWIDLGPSPRCVAACKRKFGFGG